jgi:hypothetical protein
MRVYDHSLARRPNGAGHVVDDLAKRNDLSWTVAFWV